MKKNKKYFFIVILSFFITFLSSIALNTADMQSRINNIDYTNYPKEYSVHNLLHVETYEQYMKENFTDFLYKKYYILNEKFTTNLCFENLEIEVLGCESGFEQFPIPSPYSDSINVATIKNGDSFTNQDIIEKTNAIIMYESHLKKIGYASGDYIMINGSKFYIKGVLEDNADVLRNIEQNKIQIFMPYTTLTSIFDVDEMNILAVMRTYDYDFEMMKDEDEFLSIYKINEKIRFNRTYLMSSSLATLIILFLISFVSISIVQIILIRERYNEIGIRRAVGASKDDIIFSFTKYAFLNAAKGTLLGFVAYLIVFSFIALYLTLSYHSNFFVYNLNDIFAFLLLYLLVCYLSILIPTLIGTRINISSILVEEK